MIRRGWPAVVALVVELSASFAALPAAMAAPPSPSRTSAASSTGSQRLPRERPYDAPSPGGHAAREMTPEYASIEEQGIKLVYHLRARDKTRTLMSRALRCRAELGAMLGRPVLANVEIRVAATRGEMPALAPAELPTGVSAAAFVADRLVVMSLGSPMPEEVGDLQQHLRHELAHLALDEVAPGADIPRWFHEGFAIYVSGDDAGAHAEVLTIAALRDRLLGLRDVEIRFPDGAPGDSIAAAEAAELVRFLGDSGARFKALIHELGAGATFDGALAAAYDNDVDQIDRGFRKDLARRYGFVPVLGAATLAWVVIAFGMVLRRRRIAALKAQAAEEQRAVGAAARLLAHDSPRLSAEDEDLVQIAQISQTLPPDPEVPKVEHDGRWYTLH